MEANVQAHLRKSHLLVDCGQTRVVEQMAGLEVQCAQTIHSFTKMVAEGNRDMKKIGLLTEQLALQTKNAYNLVAKLVDLTIKVKQCLSPHEQTQLDQSSALYRAGNPALMQLQNSNEFTRGRRGSNAEQLADKKQTVFWLEKALPKWNEISSEQKFKEAKKSGGIPRAVRGEVWLRCIGNGMALTNQDFEMAATQTPRPQEGKAADESLSLIEHDVPRTFHRLELFVNPKEGFSKDLVMVLERFARTNTSTGYVQGMSYIVGLMLLNMSPFDSWACFCNLLNERHLFDALFRMNVAEIVQHARLFEMMLSEELPDVYAHFHDLSVTSDHYLLDWFMTVFSRKLPLNLVLRIWDFYLLGGEIELHKVAIALIKIHKSKILTCDFESCVRELTSPIDTFDEDEFVSLVCNGLSARSHWRNLLKKIETKIK
jgi:hypothetical protein